MWYHTINASVACERPPRFVLLPMLLPLPLQAAVGEPLLYESWGKKQTYILAFTPTEVVDVTENYTRQGFWRK